MNTDTGPDLQAGAAGTYLLKRETHEIIGCAFEVLNELGHGLNEKCYENALVVEFGLRHVPYAQQKHFNVLYKGSPVGLFVPDLIAYDAVIVDPKVIDRITDHERGQMLNYLRISGLKVGFVTELQTCATGMGAAGCLNNCGETFFPSVFICVHLWLN